MDVRSFVRRALLSLDGAARVGWYGSRHEHRKEGTCMAEYRLGLILPRTAPIFISDWLFGLLPLLPGLFLVFPAFFPRFAVGYYLHHACSLSWVCRLS